MRALKVSVAEKGSVSDATSSPIALNVAVMAMMIEPTFAEQRMVGIVLSALSIQVTLAGQLGTIAQLINDQMINAYFDIGCLVESAWTNAMSQTRWASTKNVSE